MQFRLQLPVAISAFLGLMLWLSAGANGQAERRVGPEPKLWDDVAAKAIAYLRTTQAQDGSWSREKSVGVTGVVVTGLAQTGKIGRTDPMMASAVKYIESLVNPKAGHIAGNDPKVQLQNYVTSINVMALSAVGRDTYRSVISDAVRFLKKLQWDEEEGKKPDSDYYGGAGYDSQSRPDMSNTQFFAEAMVTAGIAKDDPAMKRMLIFASRCQNLKGEHNDQPWAGLINDGSFIYSAAGGGQTKSDTLPNGGLIGYGSMTYAGIKSMIYAGVSKEDPRIKKAYEWIQNNYSVDDNPGMPKLFARRGLYYYYHTMAKCLHTLELDYVVDAKGVKHDWRADLTQALAKRQRPDGSWINEDDRWMEGDPNLVTGYALMALAYCKPKK
jgi:squalene-hopene/tetraprenyl-beta-curcumene cyclase